MIVVDTNIIAHTWLPSGIKSEIQRLIRIDHEWIAPLLWRSEFRSVLCKLMRGKIIDEAKAIQLADYAEEQMAGKEFPVPTREVLAVIQRSCLSAYDSEFIALARLRNINMVTLDRKISRAFPHVAMQLPQFLLSKEQ